MGVGIASTGAECWLSSACLLSLNSHFCFGSGTVCRFATMSGCFAAIPDVEFGAVWVSNRLLKIDLWWRNPAISGVVRPLLARKNRAQGVLCGRSGAA